MGSVATDGRVPPRSLRVPNENDCNWLCASQLPESLQAGGRTGCQCSAATQLEPGLERYSALVVLGVLGGGGEAPATVRWAVSWCVSARNRLGSGRKVGRRRGRRGVAAGIVHATRLQRQLVGGDGGRRRRAACQEAPREAGARCAARVTQLFVKYMCRPPPTIPPVDGSL